MAATLTHRGPDDAGLWSDSTAGVCLGFRRLAIMDLSSAGHQPMSSPSQRYVTVINGEIYNFEALRCQLQAAHLAPPWRGRSDTEVLVACFDAWGIEATICKCVGMFAIAVWDCQQRTMTLIRDRIGEKPLYFCRVRGIWLFGSELRALLAHPAFERTIDPHSVATYMSLGYIPAPETIYLGVKKLKPGCMVKLEPATNTATEQCYWSVLEIANQSPLIFRSDADAIDEAAALLADAVSQQVVADRPVGALLSGGIDSSCIVALMQAQASSPIKTFSIGFQEKSFDEAQYARQVARHFGTDHTELYATAAAAQAVIPLLPEMYDEPFADSSQIPLYLVARLARTAVTVTLTGDGGDELLGGYPRYSMGSRMWGAIGRIPTQRRVAAAELLQKLTPDFVDHLFAWAFPHNETSGVRGMRPAQKLGKLIRVLKSKDVADFYLRLLSPWAAPELLAPDLRSHYVFHGATKTGAPSVFEDFMLRDLMGYLPDDILVKTDRAAMAVSLETRMPLLDHRFVEFSLRLPLSMKTRGGVSKWLLRQVLLRHIPNALVDRPKMGFCVPMGAWLRGPLRTWASDLIMSHANGADQFLDRRALKHMLNDHIAGVRDSSQPLWTALMFLAWARRANI